MDSRFDTSSWSKADLQAAKVADEEEVDTQDESDRSLGRESDEESATDLEEEEDGSTDKVLKPLSKAELDAFAAKQKKRGVIYISRIPPGMTVPKVKHLLESFGTVDRIFLHDGTLKPGEKRKRTSAHFTEGWVEFTSKRVAKVVAEMLNAQPIGAAAVTKSSMKAAKHQPGRMRGNAKRWKDDVWTMKYLPGFKWHMLTEQLANERASRTSRLRTELSQSAFEQKDYLRKAERSRILNEKQAKKARNAAKEGNPDAQAKAAQQDEDGRDGKRVRTFAQRAPVIKDIRDVKAGNKRSREDEGGSRSKKAKGDADAALNSVLGSIF